MEQGGERERGEEKKKSIRVIKEGNGDTISFHGVLIVSENACIHGNIMGTSDFFYI